MPPRHPGRQKATVLESIADKVIRWVEGVCRYPEGPLVGQYIKLAEHHIRAIRGIYRETAPFSGILVTKTAVISWPRKCAKTGLSACLLLAHICGPVAVRNSQLYACAMSAEQAAQLYGYAEKMVLMEDRLSERIRMRPSVRVMTCPRLGVRFKTLSSKDSVAYGASPQLCFFDELGQAEGPEYGLYTAMSTAKGAVFGALTIIISTQAADDTWLLSTLIDDGLKDIKENGAAATSFVDLVTCPAHIDPMDLTRLGEWHPGWPYDWCNRSEIEDMARKAARLPSARNSYLNLIANRRVRVLATLFTPDLWDKCKAEIDYAELKGRKAWGGLDLSITTDITALIWVVPMDDGRVAVVCRFFIPGDNIKDRSERDKVDYEAWVREGLITVCPGPIITLEWVLEQLAEDMLYFDIQELGYDRYRMKYLRKAADDGGQQLPEMAEVGQGFVSMSPCVQELEDAVLTEKLCHGGHPVLRSHVSHIVIDKDPAQNRKITRNKRTEKVDGAVALAMALGTWKKSAVKKVDTAGMIG